MPYPRPIVPSPQPQLAAKLQVLLVEDDADHVFLVRRALADVPGIEVTVEVADNGDRSVAGNAVADRVQWQCDPVIDRIVATWPARFEARIGRALGMQADAGFEDVVRAYIEQDLAR